ncbi:MAG: DNA polymerase Y family protein [Deltaproteobacteria bacterium]|nr:DNA polymerase Y family protein [Deltaproteobacteria bacterium]
MRIAAISLPELRVEVVRSSVEGIDPSLPLAIVVAPPPLTEAKLLGNTRIDVVSPEARKRGVSPGQTIAQARARAGNLTVRVVRPEAVESELARLAELALAFGATVSFSYGGDAGGDTVFVDVTGCAHLHAPPRGRDGEGAEPSAASAASGEGVLATRLAHVVQGLGHTCSVAIADGPRVAAILAHAAAAMAARSGSIDPTIVVVPPGKNAAALAPLPTTVLPLSADDVRWLSKVGVRTVAELRALPRASLAVRLGVQAPAVLALADGDDRAPLHPYTPPEIPEEEAQLEYGIEGSDALTFVAKTLTDRLAMRLAGRGVAVDRLELDLTLDVAVLVDHVDRPGEREGGAPESARGRIQQVAIDLPAPLASASDLLAALRPKIERLVLRAPVLAAKLRAASLVNKRSSALSLFEAQPKAERALPRLVAELASDLGPDAVGKLVLGDAWSPEDRSRFVRLDVAAKAPKGKTKPRHHLVSSVPEPTRVLATPVPVSRDAVKIVRHLTRLETVEWWKRLPGDHGERPKSVDYVYAWVGDAPAWVELDRGSKAARVRGWFD